MSNEPSEPTPQPTERVIVVSADPVLGPVLKQLFVNDGFQVAYLQPSDDIVGAVKRGGISRIVIDCDSTPSTLSLTERLMGELSFEADRVAVLCSEPNQDLLAQIGTLGVNAILKPIDPLTFVRQLDSAFVIDASSTQQPEGHRLLFVDDDPLDLFLVAPALHESGLFEVCLARGALDGFRRFNEVKPDIVVMALRMKELSGPALLRKLLDTSDVQSLNVIFSAQEADVPELRNFLSLGIKGVLHKPFNPATIVSQLQAILGLDDPHQSHAYPPENLTEEVQRIVGLTSSQE